MKHTIERMLHNWRNHPWQVLSYIGLLFCINTLTPKGPDMTLIEWIGWGSTIVFYYVNGLSNYNEGLEAGLNIHRKMEL